MELMMTYPLLVLFVLLGNLKVTSGLFDNSYYKVLTDHGERNFTSWFRKCEGKKKSLL